MIFFFGNNNGHATAEQRAGVQTVTNTTEGRQCISSSPTQLPLGKHKLCGELFEFLSLCSASRSSQSQADSLWLELPSVGTHAATAVELKSMTFSFVFFRIRETSDARTQR